MSSVERIRSNEFEREVLSAEAPVLVDFYADWCGSCRAMAPAVEALAEKADGRYQVVKVNVDEDPDLAVRYEIRSIPTFLIFKDGEIVSHHVGMVSAKRLASALLDADAFAAK